MKTKTAFVVLLGLFTLPSIAWAAPACDKLSALWYGQHLKDFQILWDTSTFDCPLGESKLALALYDLENIKFAPDKNGYKPDFYGLLKKNVKVFRHDNDCDSIARAGGDRITLCPAFYNDEREDRASTLVHEGRHLEADDPRHADCVGGKHDGDKAACDATFYAGSWKGSGFNADVFYLSWVLKNSHKNELRKDVLKSYINLYVPDRFNNITAEEIKKWRN